MKLLFLPVESFEDITRNFEQVQQQAIFTGSGVPTLQAPKGSYYLRTDTPSTANQRIYVNTAVGSNWTGIL